MQCITFFLLSSNDSISRKNVVFLANHKLGTVYRRTVLQFQGYDKKFTNNYMEFEFQLIFQQASVV